MTKRQEPRTLRAIATGQEPLNRRFLAVCNVLRKLYDRKNRAYNDAFNRHHKTYYDAHGDIRRKYVRLDEMSRFPTVSNESNLDISENLGDLAVYAVMCLMKFGRKWRTERELEKLLMPSKR